jgi:aspartyl protease family protein
LLARYASIAAVLCVLGIGVPKLATVYLASVEADPPLPERPMLVTRQTPVVTTARRDDDGPRPSGRHATLRADARGHFLGEAIVNGRQIDVMVDTGATSVALTDETAWRLGIRPPASAYSIPVSTANGTMLAAHVRLEEIRLGGVTVRDVEALVGKGDKLGVNLLGMSFLSRLSKFEMTSGQLVLTE